ncbi:hypothetical protein KPATCC21470_3114 [Kitasatospora purpeofusca]
MPHEQPSPVLRRGKALLLGGSPEAVGRVNAPTPPSKSLFTDGWESTFPDAITAASPG